MSARTHRSLAWVALWLALLAVAAWTLWRESDDATPPLPAQVQGTPRVLDADTWDLAGLRLRIDGLDAPELDQTCGSADAPWPCGREAAAALRAHLRGRQARCRLHGRDRHGRALATCHADGEDLQRWLVCNGWALATGTAGDGSDYQLDEIAAERDGSGIWRGDFIPPRQWRRQRQ